MLRTCRRIGCHLAVWGTVLWTQPEVAAMTVHVSPQGSDAWSGTLPEVNAEQTDGPFRSIERARDALRGLPPGSERRGLPGAPTIRVEPTRDSIARVDPPRCVTGNRAGYNGTAPRSGGSPSPWP